MNSQLESDIIARLSPLTVKIFKYPYRPAFILGFFWVAMFGLLIAARQSGNFDYFWGASVAGAIAVIGHVVVHLALSRIQRVINEMLLEVEVKINESLLEQEAAEQAENMAESDLSNKN